MADTRVPFSNGNSINQLTSNTTLVFDNATGSLGVGGATASGASLNLASATQAFLPNRGTTANRGTITPVEGMMYYDTDLNTLLTYNGSEWVESTLDVSYLSTTISWGGIFTIPVVGDVEYWRFGNMGVAYFHSILSAADVGGTFLLNTTPVPVEYSPVLAGDGIRTTLTVFDDGVQYLGNAILLGPSGALCTIGIWQTGAGPSTNRLDNSNSFAGTGNSGFNSFSMTYSVA